jgi:hypothetical protein
MKALNPCGMFKSTSTPPSPFEEFLKSEKIHAAIVPRRNFYAGIRDAAHQAYQSLIRVITNSWIE